MRPAGEQSEPAAGAGDGGSADGSADDGADLERALDLTVLALGLDGAVERRERAVPASLLDFLDLL